MLLAPLAHQSLVFSRIGGLELIYRCEAGGTEHARGFNGGLGWLLTSNGVIIAVALANLFNVFGLLLWLYGFFWEYCFIIFQERIL